MNKEDIANAAIGVALVASAICLVQARRIRTLEFLLRNEKVQSKTYDRWFAAATKQMNEEQLNAMVHEVIDVHKFNDIIKNL